MDILDEIDAELLEKKSKWSYTPMREKTETDAIIDDLLREFPSDDVQDDEQYYEGKSIPRSEPEQPYIEKESYTADKFGEEISRNEPEPYIGAAVPDNTEEQTGSDGNNAYDRYDDEYEEYYQSDEEYPDEEDDDDVKVYNPGDSVSEEQQYTEPEDNAQDDAVYEGESDHYEEDAAYEQDNYAENTAEDHDNTPEEDYDGYEDDYYDDDYPDEEDHSIDFSADRNGGIKNTQSDFNLFMDSENDAQKGDIPRFRISSVFKIIIKIVLLAAFGAFAVVGIGNIVDNGIKKYENNKNSITGSNGELKEELQSVIYPLIVTNTEDFENAANISNKQLINISVWEIIINGNKNVFLDEESGNYLIPQDQITYVVEKLFGEDIKVKHEDSGFDDIKVAYEKKNKQYVLSGNTDLSTFYPVVTDISDTDSSYMVYADCYKPSPSWDSGKSAPSKRVVIMLEKTSEYYNIKSVKTIPVEQ
ncbi:MAG: hypothetical protein NC320_07670 [Clostridium sp.]|nr:hypothetical protein [Clostridium sp.]MCM1547681.1 hypothetical protein [Ruminococcus sp.]